MAVNLSEFEQQELKQVTTHSRTSIRRSKMRPLIIYLRITELSEDSLRKKLMVLM